MLEYTHDVFVSYRRSGAGTVREWVHTHFHSLLVDCLADVMPNQPRVFIDTGVETGMKWPALLADALQGSKVMVVVCSPQYFQSPWCQAEWLTMSAREQACGLAQPGTPQGLIFPVIYSDGEHFPQEARLRQATDLSAYSYPFPAFRQTSLYLSFHQEMRTVAKQVAELLKHVPSRMPGWPVSRPKELVPALRVTVPRPWDKS